MRDGGFEVKQQVMLTRRQVEFLDEEVFRRKRAGVVSDLEAAHGGNPNVNKGVLIREALESHFRISEAPRG